MAILMKERPVESDKLASKAITKPEHASLVLSKELWQFGVCAKDIITRSTDHTFTESIANIYCAISCYWSRG